MRASESLTAPRRPRMHRDGSAAVPTDRIRDPRTGDMLALEDYRRRRAARMEAAVPEDRRRARLPDAVRLPSPEEQRRRVGRSREGEGRGRSPDREARVEEPRWDHAR